EGQTVDRKVMKRFDLLNSLSSFRAQMVVFIAVTLALTMAVQSLLNLRSEERLKDVVNDYIRDIATATNMVYHSLSDGKYLYELANQPDSLTVNDQSVIRHILVVDAENKVFDSTTEKDIGQPFKPFAEEAPLFSPGDLKGDADEIGNKQSASLHF